MKKTETLEESNGSTDSAPCTPKSSRYTKTGDEGTSVLYTGERRLKNDPAFDALGTIDELNTHLGVLYNKLEKYLSKYGDKFDVSPNFTTFENNIIDIQHRLIDMASSVATPDFTQTPSGIASNATLSKSTEKKVKRTRFPEAAVTELEKWIDELTASLPKLHAFIIPGGEGPSAYAHVARAVCRRMERCIVDLHNDTIDGKMQHPVEPSVLKYANRLSDYLFELSRMINAILEYKDVTYERS